MLRDAWEIAWEPLSWLLWGVYVGALCAFCAAGLALEAAANALIAIKTLRPET